MTTSRLFLTGVRAMGRHGVRPQEKEREREFIVDLDVEVRVGADELGQTTDYRQIVAAARAVVSERSFDLLETIAIQVANAVAALPGVVRATAVAHKPPAAESMQIDGVAAAATAKGSAGG